VFEPADPARTMPKGLVIGAIAAVIVLILLMSWLSNRSLEQPAAPKAQTAAAPPPAATPVARPAAAPAVAAQGPVVLTATAPVWLQVSEKGGATLFSGTLQSGQTYTVPSTATAPMLKTGKPEGLKATVGNAVAPPIGPPATTVHVSLLPADLMKTGQPAATPSAAAPAPAPAQPARRAKPTSPAPAAEAPPATENGAPTNTAE
jgi:hypothetical protein